MICSNRASLSPINIRFTKNKVFEAHKFCHAWSRIGLRPVRGVSDRHAIMRRLLRDIAAGKESVGDTTTLEDYSVLARLRQTDED